MGIKSAHLWRFRLYRRLSWQGSGFSFGAGGLAARPFAMGTPQSLLLPGIFLPFLCISYVTIDSFESFAKIALLVASLGPGGGIGRRTWFRSMRRKVWRFESSLGHQHVVRSNPKKSEKPRKALCLRGFLF